MGVWENGSSDQGPVTGDRRPADLPRKGDGAPREQSPTPPHSHTPTPLTGLTTPDIEAFILSLGQPRYRGRQVADWIYRRNAGSFEEMTNIPLALRTELSEKADVGRPEVAAETVGEDGTAKYLVRFHDGQTVECVWLPYRDWSSVCISSQVGCPMACAFCATGLAGFTRNLTAGEIVSQFLLARSRATRPVTHVVFMGMGEPMLNYNAVLAAIRILNTECGVGARNITLSTVGIVPGILRLAKEPLQVNLALSLHGPDDETRAAFMPIAQRYPLTDVIDAVRDYVAATHRKVTLEYLLMAGVNDAPEQADRLAGLIRGWGDAETRRRGDAEARPEAPPIPASPPLRVPASSPAPLLAGVNLIPYNETGTGFRRPSEESIRRFMARLESHGISVTRRLERGHEIAAACGQLRRDEGRPGYRMKPRS